MKIIDAFLHVFLDYWWTTNMINQCPFYFIREFYWRKLYYYNKRKDSEGDFTLELYISYARKEW